MYNFGKILKELRKNRHLTQEQLAKFLQTSRTNIACYEQVKVVFFSILQKIIYSKNAIIPPFLILCIFGE